MKHDEYSDFGRTRSSFEFDDCGELFDRLEKLEKNRDWKKEISATNVKSLATVHSAYQNLIAEKPRRPRLWQYHDHTRLFHTFVTLWVVDLLALGGSIATGLTQLIPQIILLLSVCFCIILTFVSIAALAEWIPKLRKVNQAHLKELEKISKVCPEVQALPLVEYELENEINDSGTIITTISRNGFFKATIRLGLEEDADELSERIDHVAKRLAKVQAIAQATMARTLEDHPLVTQDELEDKLEEKIRLRATNRQYLETFNHHGNRVMELARQDHGA